MVESTGRHEERGLLTWYANGTLAAPETAAVEAHLETCAACRTQLAELRQVQAAMKTAIDRRPSPSPELFARIAARIEAARPEPARRPRVVAGWWSAFEDWAATLLTPRLAPALALGLVVLQAGLLAVLGTELYRTRYGIGLTTQSGPETSTPAAGLRLRVAFHETASERAIRAALEAAGARIVDGPSAAGFYIVLVPAGPEASRAVDRLRANTAVVRFVEEIKRS